MTQATCSRWTSSAMAPRIIFIAVSPFTRGGRIAHEYADHVSIIKFIEANWGLPTITHRSRPTTSPTPIATPGNPYVPVNSPALDDLFGLFNSRPPVIEHCRRILAGVGSPTPALMFENECEVEKPSCRLSDANPSKSKEQVALELVSIEALVPDRHLLRKVDQAVDFSFIHDRVKHLYGEDNGRPALDPVVLFKLLLPGLSVRSAFRAAVDAGGGGERGLSPVPWL